MDDFHPSFDPDDGEPEIFDSAVFEFEDRHANMWEVADLIKKGWHYYYVEEYTEEMLLYLRDIKSSGARVFVCGENEDLRAVVLVKDGLHAATIALKWAS